MAALGKIQKHGVLLLVIVGVALLIFIITDFVGNGSTFFQDRKANVGSIAGEKIRYQNFAHAVQQMEDFYKIERREQALDAETSEQIREEVWNRFVMLSVIEKDAKTIGMNVSSQELTDLTIGKNPSPIVAMRQMFQNQETGQFDPQMVVQLIHQLDDPAIIKQANPEEVAMLRNYWKFLENTVKSDALIQKYNVLLSKSLVVNSKEASYAQNQSKDAVDLVYAMKPYFTISDSLVKVEKSEIEALYKQRKEQFKQEEAVDIQFVKFDIVPSEKDIAAVQSEVNAMATGFATIQDSTIVDSVNYASDVPFRDEFLARNDVPENLRAFAFDQPQGAVFGPEFKDYTFTMAKVVKSKVVADSVRLSIIAIQEETEAKTKAKADSIIALSKTTPFGQLAAQYSFDKASAAKGGDIGWFRELGLSKDIVKVFDKASSEPFVITQRNTSTIFLVTARTAPVRKVKLAVVERLVAPSSATQSKIFQEAKQFASSIKTTKEFEAKVNENKYVAYPAQNITRNQPRMMGIEGTREIIRWAFDSKPEATSDVFESSNSTLIVATVSKKYKEGYKAVEDVTDQLSAELRNDKKFEMMKKDFAGKTIEQMQAENYTVDSVKNLSFASNTAGSLGNEPSVIAKAPVAEIGKVSEPMKGKMGAYVFQVLSKKENEQATNVEQVKQMIMQSRANSVYYFAIEALKKKFEVKDQRYNFF